jgi:hypothetical protein
MFIENPNVEKTKTKQELDEEKRNEYLKKQEEEEEI